MVEFIETTSLIGSGSVVAIDVPDYAVMVGVPAKQIGWICECGEFLKSGLICQKCGRKYIEKKNGLEEVK